MNEYIYTTTHNNATNNHSMNGGKKINNNRCCECEFAVYDENGNPTCVCGNNVNELNSRYFGCNNKPD